MLRSRPGLPLSIVAMLLAVSCAAPALTPAPAASPTPPPVTITPDPGLLPVGDAPGDRFLFVETRVIVEGTGALPRLMIDFPAYTFDPETRTLRSFRGDRGISLDRSAWGFVGQGTVRRGDAGGGAASQLLPIPQLPFTTTVGVFTGKARDGLEELRQVPVVLQSVNPQGSLMAFIDGRRVILGRGASWSQVIEADVPTPEGKGHYRVTSSVTNHGWLDRSQLVPAE
ncbi:MAG: hypothetical protein K6V36_15430 [Anaerolineae bacterium]|nr:hypothetical protein [Anaerolineae bacterium]